MLPCGYIPTWNPLGPTINKRLAINWMIFPQSLHRKMLGNHHFHHPSTGKTGWPSGSRNGSLNLNPIQSFYAKLKVPIVRPQGGFFGTSLTGGGAGKQRGPWVLGIECLDTKLLGSLIFASRKPGGTPPKV